MGSAKNQPRLKVGLADVVLDVLLASREEVVKAHDVVPALHQKVNQMGPNEAGAARDQHAVHALDARAGLRLDEGVAFSVHIVVFFFSRLMGWAVAWKAERETEPFFLFFVSFTFSLKNK